MDNTLADNLVLLAVRCELDGDEYGCAAALRQASKRIRELSSSAGARTKPSAEGKLNTAAQAAYQELLLTMLPERRRTVSGQALLAGLRDAIAECTGNDPEAIQNIFEDKVRSIQGEPRLVRSAPEPSAEPDTVGLVAMLRQMQCEPASFSVYAVASAAERAANAIERLRPSGEPGAVQCKDCNGTRRVETELGTTHCPMCAPQETPNEVAWLVERRDKPQPYWIFYDSFGNFGWTPDANKALRFARKVDADNFSADMIEDIVCCEHMWLGGPPPSTKEPEHG